MFKFSMETCPQMKDDLVVQRKKGHIVSYHFPKRTKSLNKNLLLMFYIQVSKPTDVEILASELVGSQSEIGV